MREDAKENPWEDPKEFLADTFAGFTLMPTMGLRRAFATRGWKPETATAAQMFTIACDFGVGYGTLLTHLSAGVNMISRARAAALQRVTPKALRADILGALTPEPLIVADRHRAATDPRRRGEDAVAPSAGNGNRPERASPTSATWRAAACFAQCGRESFRRAPTAAPGRRSFASRPKPMSASPSIAIWRTTRMSKSKASAAPEPDMINDNNLSRAWSRLLLRILDGAGTEVSPLVLSVTGFDDEGVVPEDPAVRQAVDQLLKRKGQISRSRMSPSPSFRSASGRWRAAIAPAFSHSIVRHSRAGRR